MKKSNNNIHATRMYLWQYIQYKAMIENINDDIAAMQKSITNDVAAPVARYGDEPLDGSASAINTVEAAAARHEQIKRRIAKAMREKERLERVVRRVDRALNVLQADECKLVMGHYFYHKSWRKLGHELGYTEEWAGEKARRAVKKMAYAIFSQKWSGI